MTPGFFRRALDEILAVEGRGQVSLTFDDGNASDHDVVLPELARRGLTATFFVVPAWLGGEGRLDWNQVQELAASGMMVGSHTETHRCLGQAGPWEVAAELRASRIILEDRLGRPVRDLALPGGFAPARLAGHLAAAGYERVHTSVPARWNGRSPVVPRVCIRGDCPWPALEALLRGRPSRYLLAEKSKSLVRRLMGPRLYITLSEARHALAKGPGAVSHS